MTQPSEPYSYSGIWIWNSQPPPPAVPGEFRTDSRNWAGALLLCLWNETSFGRDAGHLFVYMQAGDMMHVEQYNNSSNWSDYTLTGPAVQQADTTWQMPVTRTAGTGQASNGQQTAVSFTVTIPEPAYAQATCSLCGSAAPEVMQLDINAGTHMLCDPCSDSADAAYIPGVLTPGPIN
jgi:hypothetical protein